MGHVKHSRMGITAMLSAVLFILLPPLAPPAATRNFVIVANKNLRIDEVTAAEISAIFLGKKRLWDSGHEIVFAVFDDAIVQEEFMQRYLLKSSWQFANYWTQRVFTGKGRMPRFLQSKQAVLEFVKTTPGAISFIPAPAEGDVKILEVK